MIQHNCLTLHDLKTKLDEAISIYGSASPVVMRVNNQYYDACPEVTSVASERHGSCMAMVISSFGHGRVKTQPWPMLPEKKSPEPTAQTAYDDSKPLTTRDIVAMRMLPVVIEHSSATPYNTSMRRMDFNLEDHGMACCVQAFELADSFIEASKRKPSTTP